MIPEVPVGTHRPEEGSSGGYEGSREGHRSTFVPKDFVEFGRAIPQHSANVRVAELAVDSELTHLLQGFERIHPGLFSLLAEVGK